MHSGVCAVCVCVCVTVKWQLNRRKRCVCVCVCVTVKRQLNRRKRCVCVSGCVYSCLVGSEWSVLFLYCNTTTRTSIVSCTRVSGC